VTTPSSETDAPTRLARRLTTADAVVVGLGAMIGAGVFSALGPAADSAGSALLVGLLIAAFVAYCNATSSAQLAALYPESGGTFVYGRRRLGRFWGYLAGWAFVVGKLASCSAMALTFGYYADADLARPLAIAAVAALAAVNYLGVEKTALLTRVIVAIVVSSLALVVAAILLGGQADTGHLTPLFDGDHGLIGVLQSAGLLFFAFAGYARVATLGEEIADPKRTIPKAIPIALGITLAIYCVVAISALMAVGADALAESDAPLVTAVRGGTFDETAPVVRIGATVASLGVLLSLMAGISRTLFAMAANRDMPLFLANVHPRYKVPDRAELAVAVVVTIVVAFADLRGAIGFSSFGVLLYYAIANASAFTLPQGERRWPRWLSVAGIIGCLLLVFTLPIGSVLAGAVVILAGCVAFCVARAYDGQFGV
jgi:basic amino acid/polyamine antiporter, APA family